MANSNRPCGFIPHGVPLRITKYPSTAAAIYPGDMVKMTSSGQIAVAAAGDLLLGAALSYVPAAGGECQVADHPDQMFSGQVAASEIDAQTDIFNCADIVATAGNSTYFLSRHAVDGSTQSGSATAQVRILNIEDAIGNALGQYVRVLVRINEHFFTAAQANSPVGT